jgi:hypothetical protein
MSDGMIKSGLKKADAGLMSACYHPAHKQWDTNFLRRFGGRESRTRLSAQKAA